ncbi:sugar-binding protein [Paenibacillus xanthanilyticus]|uniref:Sugar-binding protein n=1 Tax=Paenibacillus xanthanilyticus TaxID=1783531 RepID=A0ABV8K9F7_9BACL
MNDLRKAGLWIVMVALVLTACFAPVLPAAKTYAAGETKYEAEDAAIMDAEVRTPGEGTVFSGTGYVDLGDQANGAGLTWSNIQAPYAGNYILKLHYSNDTTNAKPVGLIVNGQSYTAFAGEQTGTESTLTWNSLTAVVFLNQGANTIKVASKSADGPEVDVLEVTPYATIFEAENGGGAAHLEATIGANTGTAAGFSGTGYVSIAAPKAGYLLYNEVVVPETGTYTIRVRYSLQSGTRPYAVTVNDVRVQDAKALATGGWNMWRFEELTGIPLQAGTNTLKIERIGANSTPVIDRFEIVNEKAFEVGDQTFRTTTFETNDVDPVIAGTAANAALNTPLINGSAMKSTSASTAKIVEQDGNRWAEVTTPAFKPGAVGFPFHSSWTAPVPMKSYTLESSFMLKDDKANYIFKLVNAAGAESPIFVLGLDNKLYARSDNKAGGALAARADWALNTRYDVKLVFHLDTKSYDMYWNGARIVNSEPMQDDPYLGGLKGFFLDVKDGARMETKIWVDDIQLSGSNAAGTAPIVNPNPGALFVEQPYIGTPVVYYVSPTGLDTNNGLTPTTPFKTINKAVSATNPGDTVNIMPGIYSPANDANDFVLINRSGAKDVKTGVTHYITYKAFDPANKPKLLLPPNIRGVWDMVQVDANYIIIEGIEIEGNNLNLTLAEAEANYEHKVAGGTDWSRYALTNTNGISVKGHHIIVRNAHVHHMAGGGIGGSGDYLWFHNNISNSNSWYTMFATSGMGTIDNVPFDHNTTDYRIILSNNIIYDNETKVKWDRTKNYSDGNGIIFDVDDLYDETKGKKLAINNIVYNNGGGGIHAYRSNNVHVINNTIVHNSRSPHLKYPNMDAQASDNSVFLNNISIARDEEGEYANLNSGWNNLFANNIYGGSVRFLGQNERVIDPGFVSLSEGNFHLQPDSPAIDNGTRDHGILYGTPWFGTDMSLAGDAEGNARPYAGEGAHARVDIGAYETAFNSASPLIDDAVTFNPAPPDVILEATAAQGTPSIDGNIDPIWSSTEPFQALKISDTTKEAPAATMRVLWDEHQLYVLAEVKDANLSAIGGNLWEHDSMEFFVDENNAKALSYQADDSHYRVNYLNLRSAGKNATADGFTSSAKVVEGGYIIEAALPLRTITGAVGNVIGFDAGASDDSNFDGIRDNATMWSNQRFNSHASPKYFGNIAFVAAPTITAITPVAVSTTAGTAPTLPADVEAIFSNGVTSTKSVEWEPVDASRYASAGSFAVYGTVQGTAIKAVANVTVKAVEIPNVPPTVRITSPANGAAYKKPASILFKAAASDQDGTITKVEVYQGSTLLGTATSVSAGNYSFCWTQVAAGTYSITAKAYDNKGASSVSAPIKLTVTKDGK